MRLSDQIRRAIRESQLTEYRICESLGLSRSVLNRFMRGGQIRSGLLDRIGEMLGLRVTMKLSATTRRLAKTAVRRKSSERG